MEGIAPNQELAREQRAALLEAFSGLGAPCDFASGAFIEDEYKRLDYLYLITDGLVQQYFLDVKGGAKTLLLLGPGDLFGEITLLQQDSDRVTTQAISPVRARKITRDLFFRALADRPELSRHVMVMLTGKIRNLMAQIYDTAFSDTKGTLYALLRRLALQFGEPTELGCRIAIRFTHEELARMTASTRSTITRKLAELQSEGAVRMVGRDLYVL